MDSLSYALGVLFATNLSNEGLSSVDGESLKSGFEATLAGDATMSASEADAIVRTEMTKLKEEQANAFKEEGDNFQQPCYRKHSSTWIDGWNITTDWDEIDYDEALENRREGPPTEGQLVVTYKVDIVERDEEERERLKNCSFLCGMPRPPKGISAMESDHHLHNRYLDDSA